MTNRCHSCWLHWSLKIILRNKAVRLIIDDDDEYMHSINKVEYNWSLIMCDYLWVLVWVESNGNGARCFTILIRKALDFEISLIH